jgi:hypothetical protein
MIMGQPSCKNVSGAISNPLGNLSEGCQKVLANILAKLPEVLAILQIEHILAEGCQSQGIDYPLSSWQRV